MEKNLVAVVALMDTPDGRLYTGSELTFVKISAVQVWAQIVPTVLVGLALVSVPLFALVWSARWIFRRMRAVPMLHVRALPLCAWLLGVGGLLLTPDLLVHQENALARFARITAWSVALAVASGGGAALSVPSLVAAVGAWKHRKTMNPFAYYHSLAVAVLFVVAVAYLAWWGVIPYLSWA